MGRSWLVFVGCSLLACTSYVPGAVFRQDTGALAPNRVESECVDLVVAPFSNAPEDAPQGAVLLELHFGNRCKFPVVLDFRRIAVTFVTADVTQPVLPFDPRHEIAPATLDAVSEGIEHIYYLPSPASPAAPPTGLCVDVRHAFPRVHANAPLCFARDAGGTWQMGVP